MNYKTMDYVKVLHIADVHIGRKYHCLSKDKSALRHSETLLSLQNTLDRFCDAQVVLVSGDLFEEDCPDESVTFVADLFNRHKDKYFFVSCGNHDCCESLPMKGFAQKTSDNVFVFGDTIKKITVDELNVAVYGISFSAPCSYTSLLNGFAAEDEDCIKIMTMHAELSSDSRYNPVTKHEIASSGLSYLALGHVHSFSGIMNFSGVSCAYPGVFEAGGFDEQGECGVIYGKVYSDRTELDFYPVSCRQYLDFSVDISDLSSDEQVAGKIFSLINPENLYRISLVGTRRSFVPNTKLYTEICKCFYMEITDYTTFECDILDFCDEYSLKGLTSKALLELKDSYDDAVFSRACDILTNLMCKG